MTIRRNYPTKKNTTFGWYSRGYLPHFDDGQKYQFITFRLGDSIPSHVLRDAFLGNKSNYYQMMEKYLDNNLGSRILLRADVAKIILEGLLFGHNIRYELVRWVIMPNHVHLLIRAINDYPISKAIKLLKSYTANEINRLLGRTGSLWARDYFDTYIRDEEHFGNCIRYIDNNPVKAKLVEEASIWKWSSVGCAAGKSLLRRSII